MYRIIIILSILSFASLLEAQEVALDSVSQDTTVFEVSRSNGILDVFEGNPGKAAIRGLLFPAGGQIYNKRWWKVPLALAAEGAAIGLLVYNYDRFRQWDQEYTNVVLNNRPATLGQENPDLILQNRNSLRQDRELAWVAFAGIHILVAFESYIDRHLIEFDVSDDLSFIPINSLLGPIPSLTYTIPLNTEKYKKADSLMNP